MISGDSTVLHASEARENGWTALAAVLLSVALALLAIFVYAVPSVPYAFDSGDRCAEQATGPSSHTAGWSWMPPGVKCVSTGDHKKVERVVGPDAPIGWLSVALLIASAATMTSAVAWGRRIPTAVRH